MKSIIKINIIKLGINLSFSTILEFLSYIGSLYEI